jgi:hypothetical protein
MILMICHTCIMLVLCVGGVVLLCALCFGELMSHGTVQRCGAVELSSFMRERMRVGDFMGLCPCFVWLCGIM